ncbi:MAG: UbiA family prenyltransferase [Gemmataceae bacterium]
MNRPLAFVQLFRVPNVFTAIADVAIGLAAGAPFSKWLWLAVSSASLYSSGMVGNDYVDRHVDARERPNRPIPSGRVTPRVAFALAVVLSLIGLAASAIAGWQSVAVAVPLLVLIVAYNAWLKNTFAGPLVLGGCRFLNVALGFSTGSFNAAAGQLPLVAAAIVAVYILGVSIFARDEAGQSRVFWLLVGAILMSVALAATIVLPVWTVVGGRSWAVIVAALLAGRLILVIPNALWDPSPVHVQAVIKASIIGLIALDAALATSLAGPVGLLLLILIVPAQITGRWIYST